MKKIKHLYQNLRSYYIVKKNLFTREKYNDRNVLERIIFPFILSHFNPKTILDVGREDYQGFYNDFFTGRELWTMDVDPERKEFGAKNHITDSCTMVEKHFKKDYFDFILMNGVMNWGLNRPDSIEKAITGIYNILKPGGIFVLGWNDFHDVEQVKPEQINAFKNFRAYKFPPLKTAKFECVNGEHIYNFYIKPNHK